MTGPQHLPDWRREEDEANQQTEQEYRERLDRHCPLDPAAEQAPWDESEGDDDR